MGYDTVSWVVPSVSKNCSTFRTPGATYPTAQCHTSQDLSFTIFCYCSREIQNPSVICLLRTLNCDDHYPKSVWQQDTLITLFNISPQNSVLEHYKAHPTCSLLKYWMQQTTSYITLSIIRLEVLKQVTVIITVFKNIMLCNLVAKVAMIHRNLLPSYGDERSACSPNTLVPVYSKT
jgi:hypothetical protein